MIFTLLNILHEQPYEPTKIKTYYDTFSGMRIQISKWDLDEAIREFNERYSASTHVTYGEWIDILEVWAGYPIFLDRNHAIFNAKWSTNKVQIVTALTEEDDPDKQMRLIVYLPNPV